MKKSQFAYYKNCYRSLFTAALAICGSEPEAESVMLDAICGQGNKYSYKGALAQVKRIARERVDSDCEPEFLVDSPLSDETALVRRIAILSFGLGFGTAGIAEICGVSVQEVRSARLRVSRVPDIAGLCEGELSKGECAPDAATFRQLLQSRKTEDTASARRTGLLKGIVSVLLILVIGFAVWTGAVLLNYYSHTAAQNQTEVNDVND